MIKISEKKYLLYKLSEKNIHSVDFILLEIIKI